MNFVKKRQILRVLGKCIKSTLRLFNSLTLQSGGSDRFFYKFGQYLYIKFYGV